MRENRFQKVCGGIFRGGPDVVGNRSGGGGGRIRLPFIRDVGGTGRFRGGPDDVVGNRGGGVGIRLPFIRDGGGTGR